MSPDDERRRLAANALEVMLDDLPSDGDRLAVLSEGLAGLLARFDEAMRPMLLQHLLDGTASFVVVLDHLAPHKP